MNGIIYCIINKIDNKKYVGQTTVGLKQRYQLNWWKKSHNPYIKHAVEKYGVENFEFEILENGIDSIKKLNQQESFYASNLDTYIPNGYNIRLCGHNKLWHEESKQKLSDSKSQPFQLKNVMSGNIISISNLRIFCKENNLNVSALQNLRCGISNYSQGYVRPETDPNTTTIGRLHTFMSPNGDIIKGTITYLSKKYELKSHVFSHLVKGHCKTCKGWSLIQVV